MILGARSPRYYVAWTAVDAGIGSVAIFAYVRLFDTASVALGLLGLAAWLSTPALVCLFFGVFVSRRLPRVGVWFCRLGAVLFVFECVGWVYFGLTALAFIPATTAAYFTCAAVARDHRLDASVLTLTWPVRWWWREWIAARDHKKGLRAAQRSAADRAAAPGGQAPEDPRQRRRPPPQG